jgi:U3 small nucleolar RNA-associated protein 23
MGRECKDASFAARALECVRGGPDPPNASALDSILAAVEDANAERFLVCTQDESLRRALSSDHPAVPVVFAHTSGLQMEPPSDADATGVASRKESGVGLRDDEREKLGQEESARDVTRVRTNVRYAKPKAKGPNPLSAKKKRKRLPKVDDGATRKENHAAPGAAEGGVKKKRKRRGGGGGEKT